MGSWFFAIAVVVIAALTADRLSVWFRRALLFVAILVVVCTLAEIASGMLRLQMADDLRVDEFHRWAAHGLVITHWILLCVGIGAAIASCARQRWLLAIALVTFPVVAFFFSLSASFTGYLHPSDTESTDKLRQAVNEENGNRFLVLHTIVLPSLLLVCQLAIVAAAWRLRKPPASLLLTPSEADEPV